MVAAAACDQSRDEPDAAPVETVVVDLPPPTADIEAVGESASDPDEQTTAEPDTSEEAIAGDTSSAGASTGDSLSVPFADYFDVDPFGAEPVRGSGCGLDAPIGDELPDGLWRGYVRAFDGLWVDAATSLEFDLACVYTGDAAAEAEREWRDGHPDVPPVEVPDGFLVNDNDRVRTVPLSASFVQVDAQWNDAGQCMPPETLPPSGETEVYLLLDSWLLVVDGDARWAVTSCLPQ